MVARWLWVVAGVAASLSLAGCVVDRAKQAEQRPALARSELQHATEPIQFARIVASIKIGTPIGGLYAGLGCYGSGVLTWNEASGSGLRSPEYETRFIETMSRAGYRVVGSENRLFDVEAERMRARYQVAAQLADMDQRLCNDPSSGPYGEAYVAIDWQVYSLAERRVVYKARTEGNARTETGDPNGRAILTRRAFSQATANLAADPKFRDAVAGATVGVASVGTEASLEIPRYPLFLDRTTTRMADSRNSAVTILAGGRSLGSGFFISDTGHILTNRHVVGEAETVDVRLVEGVELTGRVLRRHTARDVALVKVELGRTRALPLRLDPVKIGEGVYAIGSPLRPDLSGSVTRGIVSALRREARGPLTLDMIQSDAAIQGGNSGGPLLDDAGNVVGIAVEGIGPGGVFSAGVNFFIPIDDALRYLNIRLGQPRELRF